ncbi:hypothetical protein RJ640_003011 [Escallonia rubra]|uniref:ATP-dependent DNA helicase n=1 Tax=Escallonia rubra TaxID=112253 RepID=A0AA88R9M2_9ASTE|nr:hypothetical protein RJ640_003011 [Escallonia rubra]
MFMQWMKANDKYEFAKNLTYSQFPEYFVWDRDALEWVPRKRRNCIGRMVYVHPTSSELFYLIMLLSVVRGPTCYEELRTVNGLVYKNYRQAWYHSGLLDDDGEWHDALSDAARFQSGRQLRDLFVTMLLFCEIAEPLELWNMHWKDLSDDIEYSQRRDDSTVNFGKWILDLGDGNVPMVNLDGETDPCWIKLLPELLIKPGENSIQEIVDVTYPNLLTKHKDGKWKEWAEWLRNRAILTPKNEEVEKINSFVLSTLPGEVTSYESSNTICKASTTV